MRTMSAALGVLLCVMFLTPCRAKDTGELPFWPVGITLPDQKDQSKATILAWVPPETKKIRAVLMTVENTDSILFAQYPPLREVAKKHGMALVHARLAPQARVTDPENPHSVQKILDAVAAATSMPEFRHAPFITFGKSSQGQFPFTTAWKYPKRTIATISYHAETPSWPMPDWVKLDGETILHVNANGEAEWGGTWYLTVRPALLNYRANTAWLPHQTIARNTGHGDYPGTRQGRTMADSVPGQVGVRDTFDYLTVFVDKALTLRVPAGEYPTDAPVALKQVDEASGYLIEPFAIEDLFQHNRQYLGVVSNAFSGTPTTAGFVAIEPATGFIPPQGTPVVPLTPSKSPDRWLLTDSLPLVMKADPLGTLGDLLALRPKPDDAVTIDGTSVVFRAYSSPDGGKGGISLTRNGAGKGASQTLIGYTILDVPAPMQVKVIAPYTPGGRLRVVLNGRAVDHLQTVQLQKGLYPMLVVLRLKAYHGVSWSVIEPRFEDISEPDIKLAKQYQEARTRQEPVAARRRADVLATPSAVLHPAAEVKPEDRKKMFWVADKEQAEAWLKYHSIVPLVGR